MGTPTMPAARVKVITTSTVRADPSNAKHGQGRSNSTTMFGALNRSRVLRAQTLRAEIAFTVWCWFGAEGLHNSFLRVRACRVAAESRTSIQAALATDCANLKKQAGTLLDLGSFCLGFRCRLLVWSLLRLEKPQAKL